MDSTDDSRSNSGRCDRPAGFATAPTGDKSVTGTTLSGRYFAAVWFAVSLVFLGASLIQVPVPGINEPHYLTKSRAFADPEWCARDFFLQSANAHFVFFALAGPLTSVMPFAAVAVIGRIFSLCLLALGWCMTARRLGLSAVSITFAAIAFCLIASTGNLSGEWVVGGFEGKVAAYGLALAGTANWMDGWLTRQHRSYLVAGLLLGAAVSLHPVVGAWFCVGIAIAELLMILFRARQQNRACGFAVCNARRFLVNGIVLTTASIFTALPGLIPAARMILSTDLPPDRIDRANFIQVFWRLDHHLDPSTFPASAWLHTGVLLAVGAFSLGIAWILGRRRSQANNDAEQRSSLSIFWQPMLVLLWVAAGITGVGCAVGWHSEPAIELPDWQWRADVLKFYPFRFFDALLPIMVALASGLLLDVFSARKGNETFVRVAVSFLLLAVFFGRALSIRPVAPAGYSPATFAAWRDACQWIRQNTESDALIFGPREGFGLKWFAHRSEFVCFKDCPQDAAGILEWNNRLWRIHHWSATSYEDELFGRDDTKKLHQQTGITHILTRRLGPFEQAPVFENEYWRVYEIAEPAAGEF